MLNDEIKMPRKPKRLIVYLLLIALLNPASLLAKTQASPNLSIIRYNSIHHPIRVQADNGMVVSQRALASQIGYKILSQGGNAVDAAVAVGFALSVLLPRAGNIGGGGFMLVYVAEQDKTIAIDYREKAPVAAHRALYLDADGQIENDRYKKGIQSVAVPGTVAGLDHALKHYGTFSLAQVMQPAIDLAEQGFVMDYDTASAIAIKGSLLNQHASARKLFFNSKNQTVQAGELFRQEDLAKSLKLIAEQGANAFYKGGIADLIVAQMEREGGLITHQDLADYQISERQPLVGNYRGYKVVTMPPPSSGGMHLLQMLGVLSNFDLQEMGQGSADALHTIAETMRHAYADRSKHSGDGDFQPVPIDLLTSKGYTAKIAKSISADRITPSSEVLPVRVLPYESEDTTHFSVVDGNGNAVSNTYTLNYSFGSGVVVEGAGFLLNNEMTDFNAAPDQANPLGVKGGDTNAIEPGKRPMSSMTPTLLFKDGELALVTGSPGGSRIINTVLQQLVNLIDFGLNLASATHAPRIHHQWYPDRLEYESGVGVDTLQILKGKGHELKKAGTMGSLQSIQIEQGVLMGASDPRRPGAGVAINGGDE